MPITRMRSARKILIVTILLVAVVGVAFLAWPLPRPEVIGNLPDKDVNEITAVVRHELRKEVLPRFSWESVRELPSSIRRYRRSPILSITVHTDGTVEVMTGKVYGPLNGSGRIYQLKRGAKGWEVTSEGLWVASAPG